jgi:ABC-type transport system involved in cytochrome c biogenesis permease subunit
MNTASSTLNPTDGFLIRRWGPWDLGFGLLAALGAAFATQRYAAFMDIYELVILWCCVPAAVLLGYFWAALRPFFIGCAAASILAVAMYGGTAASAESNFLLKYFLASQSAILWMCALFAFATVSYWVGLFAQGQTALWMGSLLTWSACVMGSIGLLVRWYESYLISPDVGHIPVSNLYEVFILFAVITAMFYLYYEGRYKTRSLGGFVSLIITAAVAFLLWYIVARSGHEIQPLVPALQSWWMKIHVPANFVGYGTFSLAAMVGFAYLIKENATRLPLGSLHHCLFLACSCVLSRWSFVAQACPITGPCISDFLQPLSAP